MKMSFHRREKGQGLMEYGLVIILVAIIIIALLTLIGSQLYTFFSQLLSSMS